MSISLNNVTYTYMQGTPYERTAISEINLEIKKGEFVGIIGHTGSGKSTLVQHLNGLLKPTNGEVIIDGVNANNKGAEAKAVRRKVGMVFQYPEHQLFEETIAQDIAFGPHNLDLDEEEISRRVKRAMAFVGLDYDIFADRSPFQLSGGQMRRVAIAGVIALEPEYLVLDEPSAGLDPRGRNEIFGQIISLYKSTGITVVLVSHNMEDIVRMANRLIVLHQGKIKLDGKPLDIFRNSQTALRESGVDIPHVTALLAKLRKCGLEVDDSAATVHEAAVDIYDALRRQGKC